MKRMYFLLLVTGLLTLTLSQTTSAQKDSSGIYKTAEDFQNRKLSYAINYKTEKHKIKDNILFNADKIVVKHKGETYMLVKRETYGFKNTRGIVFRFVDSKDYKVLNTGEPILIYVYDNTVHSGKNASNKPYQWEYYFSKDAISPPQSLTLPNVKAIFPENHKFHDALDAQFKSDKELYAYDSFHKMYKLNWIYRNAIK